MKSDCLPENSGQMVKKNEAKQMLLNGVDGKEVKEKLMETYTLRSTNTYMSEIRKYIEKHHADRNLTNLETFKLTKEEVCEVKKKKSASLIQKHKNLIRIDCPSYLLGEVVELLKNAQPSDSYCKLVMPLAIVSGRRHCEYMSVRSTFKSAGDGEDYYCMFTGQLKKSGKAEEYCIPLLVPFNIFNMGWTALREKQKQLAGGKLEMPEELDDEEYNQELHKKYSKDMNRDMKKRKCLQYLPKTDIHEEKNVSIHKLRAIYLAYVYQLFDCPCSDHLLGMKILGHCTVEDSLSYKNVRLENCDGFLDHFRGYCGLLQIKV